MRLHHPGPSPMKLGPCCELALSQLHKGCRSQRGPAYVIKDNHEEVRSPKGRCSSPNLCASTTLSDTVEADGCRRRRADNWHQALMPLGINEKHTGHAGSWPGLTQKLGVACRPAQGPQLCPQRGCGAAPAPAPQRGSCRCWPPLTGPPLGCPCGVGHPRIRPSPATPAGRALVFSAVGLKLYRVHCIDCYQVLMIH